MNKTLAQALERWSAQGLISADQRAAIEAAEAARPEDGPRLTTITQYAGGLLILFAYTIFWGARWDALAPLSQAVVAAISMLAIGAIGALLRRRGATLGGNLLLVAAAGIFGLLVNSLLRAAGIWPESPGRAADPLAWDVYEIQLARAQALMTALALVGALLALWWTRFPLLAALAAGWGWFLVDSGVRLALDPTRPSGGPEQIATALYGAALLALGLWVGRAPAGEERAGLAFWTVLSGALSLLLVLGAYAVDRERALAGLIFLLAHLALIWLSIRTGRRTLLVFGALGAYAYIARLALDTFRESLGFPVALAVIGLSLVLGAVFLPRLLGERERVASG
jgi:hypothetical protein